MVQSGSAQSETRIRDVETDDLEAFFEHQRDPEAVRMAAFPAREREAFMAHWAKIRADESNVTQAVVVAGEVVGNVVSWEDSGRRYVGYWIDRSVWGRGIATQALALLLRLVTTRPLYAYVAVANVGSTRVLEKCGFRRVRGHVPEPGTEDADDVEEYLMVLESAAQDHDS
jgi:RimJ/RimL family protein N-acetyltransferase